MDKQLPPHDLVAEQSVLGAMLLSREAVTNVPELLRAEHFYRPIHADIYEAITFLANAGEPVDAITVGRELEKRSRLTRIGGAPYLHTLVETVPVAASATYYARIVFDRWRQRRLIEVGQRIAQIGYVDATTSDDVDQLIVQVDAEFGELGADSAQIGTDWDDLVKKWKAWQTGTSEIIPSPWMELNNLLPGFGFHAGQLIIFGARPGQGKSNAGLNVVLDAAEKGHKTTVFSVEMDDVEVVTRLLAAGSYANVGQLFAKNMDTTNRDKVNEYIKGNKGLPLQVVDQAYITVEKIVSHCRIRRPKVIFVDYTQLISPSNDKLIREQQVAHITRSLKVAAKHLQMVVIAASQLKRPQDADREPRQTDLRESGAAEQDADIVILLHRIAHDKVNMIVAKNRNGSLGRAGLRFRGDKARIG